MAYNPNMYMPQNYQPYRTGPGDPISQPGWTPNFSNTQVQPYDARIKVKGRNGAEAYWMPPNSHAILFDEDSDVMYYKATDAAGYASVSEFDFYPRKDVLETTPDQEYVSRSEFDSLVQEVKKLIGADSEEVNDGK